MLKMVVSGGQTGVDRAALDAARRTGLAIGGWCPKGRRAEDGPIPPEYPLNETASEDYETRTRWNVRDSTATLILTHGALSGGTALTAQVAHKLQRPFKVVDLAGTVDNREICTWIKAGSITSLNVAGPRESRVPGIYALARAWLVRLFLAEREGITLENCVLGFKCEQRWSQMKPVDGLSTVRWCGGCERRVYYCNTDEELAGNVRQGRCVAFDREAPGTARKLGKREEPLYLGMVLTDYSESPPLQWD